MKRRARPSRPIPRREREGDTCRIPVADRDGNVSLGQLVRRLIPGEPINLVLGFRTGTRGRLVTPFMSATARRIVRRPGSRQCRAGSTEE